MRDTEEKDDHQHYKTYNAGYNILFELLSTAAEVLKFNGGEYIFYNRFTWHPITGRIRFYLLFLTSSSSDSSNHIISRIINLFKAGITCPSI